MSIDEIARAKTAVALQDNPLFKHLDAHTINTILYSAINGYEAFKEPTKEQPVDCREAFEKWYLAALGSPILAHETTLQRCGDGYMLPTPYAAWRGWQEAWDRRVPMRESRYRDSDIGRQPIETAPKGVPVIVAGGVAMQKTGGEWFTGMEEPLYQRPLQWEPTWWMPIPTDNTRRGSDD